MDPENQAQINEITQNIGSNNLCVVLGASDIEAAEIAAETVTEGDPSFAGPLAGVSLRLPVYHILEPKVRDSIPTDVYEKEVGILSMIVDSAEVGKKFEAIREATTRPER